MCDLLPGAVEGVGPGLAWVLGVGRLAGLVGSASTSSRRLL